MSDSCTFYWKPPEDDGGTPLTHYVIEMAEGDRKVVEKWKECGEVKADELSFKVQGLEEGRKYKLRVRAQNKVGLSEPAGPKDAFEAKNPWGKSFMRKSTTGCHRY